MQISHVVCIFSFPMVTFSHVNKKALENSSKYWQLFNLQLIEVIEFLKAKIKWKFANLKYRRPKFPHSFWDSDLVLRLEIWFKALRTYKGWISNSLQPKFKSQSQRNIWDVDIKAFCRNNGLMMKNMDMYVTHCTKMGANSSAENTPKYPRIYLTNLSAWAQKFTISMKKIIHFLLVCLFKGVYK